MIDLCEPWFFVPGLPQPKGSGSRKLLPASCPRCHARISLSAGIGRLGPYVESADGRTARRPAGGLKRWAAAVARIARAHARHVAEGSEAVALELHFYLPRPPSVSTRKRPDPTTAPDVDKLARAVQDALAGILYDSDGQVVELVARKHYGLAPGVMIRARLIATEQLNLTNVNANNQQETPCETQQP